MRIGLTISRITGRYAQRGVTLFELLVFIVIISIALVTFLGIFGLQVTQSVDPVARVKALEKGQAMLDEVLSRKFADNTPTGGVPACSLCDGIEGYTPGSLLNDVGDYAGYNDGDTTYPVSVAVVEAGDDLGIDVDQARLVTVTVGVPGSGSLTLSAYRVNF